MSYKKADELLPAELVRQIQQYVDGTSIYIPRREDNRRHWGCSTNFKAELTLRNQAICREYAAGASTAMLAAKYHLSKKHIQRIVREEQK